MTPIDRVYEHYRASKRRESVWATTWAIVRLPYYLLAPSVDNVLHIATKRDLQVFRAGVVCGRLLSELVEERVGPCEWSARHDRWIFATEIEGMAPDGGRMRWGVSHSAPRTWLPVQPAYITPLNRGAADAVPELLPSGFPREMIPVGGYCSGLIHDEIAAAQEFGWCQRSSLAGLTWDGLHEHGPRGRPTSGCS